MADTPPIANFLDYKKRRDAGSASITVLIDKLKAHVAAQRTEILEGLDTNPEYLDHERGPVRRKLSALSLYEEPVTQADMHQARQLLDGKWDNHGFFDNHYIFVSEAPISDSTCMAINQILGAVALTHDAKFPFLQRTIVPRYNEEAIAPDGHCVSINERDLPLLKEAKAVIDGRQGMQL